MGYVKKYFHRFFHCDTRGMDFKQKALLRFKEAAP
jgi:hypothetical protein